MPVRIFAQVRTSGLARNPEQVADALDFDKISAQTAARFEDAWRFNTPVGATQNLRESLDVNFHARGWEISSTAPYAQAVAAATCFLYRTIKDANILETVSLVARDNIGRFARLQR